MATIGELLINIKAGTASFVADLNRVKNLSFDTASQITRSMSVIGTAAMGMLGAFAVGMAVAVDKTVEFETHMARLAQSAGTSTETMSGLSYAAKMVGMNVDQVALAMERFDKKLQGVGTNKATADLMKQFGIDKGSLQTSEQALMKLADRFNLMPDGIQKTGIAMQFFGKAGAAMIPILEKGSKGIEDMFAEAKKYGMIVDTATGEAAIRFEENSKRLGAIWDGLVRKAADAAIATALAWHDVFTNTEQSGQHADAFYASAGLSENPEALNKVTSELKASADAHDKNMKALKAMTEANPAAEAAAKKLADAIKSLTDKLITQIGAVTKSGESLKGLSAVQQEHVGIMQHLMVITGNVADATKLYDLAMLGANTQAIENERHLISLAGYYEALKKQTDAGAEAMKKEAAADKTAQRVKDMQALAAAIDQAITASQRTSIPGAGANPIFGASSAAGITGDVAGAFKEQTDKLKEQIATFGMADSAAEIYRLTVQAGAQSNTEAFQAQLAALKALQSQLGALDAAAKAQAKASAEMKNVWKSFGEVAYKSLDEMIFSGKKFTAVLHDILKSLGELMLKGALFGFGEKNAKGGGGLFGMLFSGSGEKGRGGLGGLLSGGLLSGLFKHLAPSGGAITGAPASLGDAGAGAGAALNFGGGAGPGGAGGIFGLITSIQKAFFGSQSSGSAAAGASSTGLVGDFSKAWFGTTSSATAAAGASSGGLAGDFSSLWLGGESGSLGGSSGLGSLLSGLMGSLSIAGFAGGGPVGADVPILVGENGPEIFTPGSPGNIISNGGMGGGSSSSVGGATVNYNIDARGADVGVETRIRAAIAASENRAVARALQAANEAQLRTSAG